MITDWSKEWSAKRATLISKGSKKFCNRLITVGLEADMPISAIAKSIREGYDTNKIYRSYRMARTEVVGASNYGSWQGAKQAEIPDMQKTWVSARDDRVRDNHGHIDGITIKMDAYFDVGGSPMSYPGDPAGPGDETIMCRCAISYKTTGVIRKPIDEGRIQEDFFKRTFKVESGKLAELGARSAKSTVKRFVPAQHLKYVDEVKIRNMHLLPDESAAWFIPKNKQVVLSKIGGTQIDHEIGHAVWFGHKDINKTYIEQLFKRSVETKKGFVSAYSKTNASEYFAESYRAFGRNAKAFKIKNEPMHKVLEELL